MKNIVLRVIAVLISGSLVFDPATVSAIGSPRPPTISLPGAHGVMGSPWAEQALSIRMINLANKWAPQQTISEYRWAGQLSHVWQLSHREVKRFIGALPRRGIRFLFTSLAMGAGFNFLLKFFIHGYSDSALSMAVTWTSGAVLLTSVLPLYPKTGPHAPWNWKDRSIYLSVLLFGSAAQVATFFSLAYINPVVFGLLMPFQPIAMIMGGRLFLNEHIHDDGQKNHAWRWYQVFFVVALLAPVFQLIPVLQSGHIGTTLGGIALGIFNGMASGWFWLGQKLLVAAPEKGGRGKHINPWYLTLHSSWLNAAIALFILLAGLGPPGAIISKMHSSFPLVIILGLFGMARVVLYAMSTPVYHEKSLAETSSTVLISQQTHWFINFIGVGILWRLGESVFSPKPPFEALSWWDGGVFFALAAAAMIHVHKIPRSNRVSLITPVEIPVPKEFPKDLEWLVGSGAYQYLDDPADEVRVLQRALARPPSPANLSDIGLMRRQRVLQEWELWEKPLRMINDQMEVLRKIYGDAVYGMLREKIIEIESSLPFEDPKDQRDNYRKYVLNIFHGLYHSLIVTDWVYRFADVAYVNKPTVIEQVRPRLAIDALYHDLTSLIEAQRPDHHISAAAFVRHNLPKFRDPKNPDKRRYTDSEVEQSAQDCYTHRGQEYPKPVTRPGEIFMYGDEMATVLDLERIASMPKTGIFNPDDWEVYLSYILKERRNFFGRARFVHDTRPPGPLFRYLMHAVVVRTNTEIYASPVAKKLLENIYPQLRSKMFRLLEEKLNEEVKDPVERQHQLDAMNDIMVQMEALHRRRPDSMAILRKRFGTREELLEKVRLTLGEIKMSARELWTEGPSQEARQWLDEIYILQAVRSQEKNGARKERKRRNNSIEILMRDGVKHGLALLDQYLEHGGMDLESAILALEKHFNRAEILTGFAYGLMKVSKDRLLDFFGMRKASHEPVPAFNPAVQELSWVVVKHFLSLINEGQSPNAAAEWVRRQINEVPLRVLTLPTGQASTPPLPALEGSLGRAA